MLQPRCLIRRRCLALVLAQIPPLLSAPPPSAYSRHATFTGQPRQIARVLQLRISPGASPLRAHQHEEHDDEHDGNDADDHGERGGLDPSRGGYRTGYRT
jgi:hypothetical protein